jgi:hypothetical protein
MDEGKRCEMKRSLARMLAISAIFGTALGVYFLYVGIGHNTQGEFVGDSGQVDILYCIKVFGAWFVVGAVLGTSAYLLWNAAMKVWRRSN